MRQRRFRSAFQVSKSAANLREQPSKEISPRRRNRLKQLGFLRVAERVGFVTPP
jgi:hypothetical protein